MTDPTGFSIGMQVDPSTPFKPLPDWVALDLCHAYPVPDGNLLVHNPRNGKRVMVKPEVYAALLHCRQFKTLDQHAAALVEFNPDMQGQQADIRRVLQSMLKGGIMSSAKHACDRLKSKTESRPAENTGDEPVVAILTWERPQALQRLLESIAANCDSGKIHCLYVIDDSRKAENISKNQALAEQFAQEISCPVQYFGQAEQQSLLDKLVKELPEHENAIQFLADRSRWINHWTAGLTRNLALLLSCGRRLVMIDDDAVCDVYDPPGLKPDITFSDHPREALFFGSEQEWAYLRQAINPDPIDRHMRCLGLSFSQALERLGQENLKPAGFKASTALELSELQPDSAVLVTECGSLGCPGTNSNTWLPDMAPDSLSRMLASAKQTGFALESRKVWSGRNHPHFSPRPNMSQLTGFDNRRMLPPYLPMIRGQDRVFGYMLDFIFPNAVTLDYPWAIPHLPIPDRKWSDRDLNFTPADSFPMFFVENIVEHKSVCLSVSPGDRLSGLALWFKDMAGASADALTSMYRDSRLRSDAGRLGHLTALLAQAEHAPVTWTNYLRNGITQLNADMERASREDFRVKGSPAELETEDLIAFWRKVWEDFSAALEAWPDIREAASRIVSPARSTA